MPEPLVSILINNYNYGRYLGAMKCFLARENPDVCSFNEMEQAKHQPILN